MEGLEYEQCAFTKMDKSGFAYIRSRAGLYGYSPLLQSLYILTEDIFIDRQDPYAQWYRPIGIDSDPPYLELVMVHDPVLQTKVVEVRVKRKGWCMEEKMVGKVTHYFGKVSAAMIDLSDTLKVGDKIHIKGTSSDFVQDVTSMQVEHTVITEGKAGDKVGIGVTQKVHEHDVVYKIAA